MPPAPVEREFRIVVPSSGRCLSKHHLTESEILWLRSDNSDIEPVHIDRGNIERMEINGAADHLLTVLRDALANAEDDVEVDAESGNRSISITWEDSATAPRAKELISLAVRFEVLCPSCRLAVAVGGLCERVACPGCQTEIVLGRDFVHEVLAEFIDDYVDDMEGLTGSLATTTGPAKSKIRGQLRRAAPTCEAEACARELPMAALEAAWRAGEDSVVCPACHHSTKLVRSDLASVVHRDARATMLEQRPAPRLEGGGGACVFCEECGDAVYLAAFTEAVECDTCEETVRIDQATWERAIAHPGVREFYVLLDRMEPARPQVPSKDPPPPTKVPVDMSRAGLIVGLMLPGWIVTWGVAWSGFGSEELLGATVTAALLLLGLARWLAYGLMVLFGRTSLEFGRDAFSVPPVALFALRRRQVAYADLEGCEVQRPRHKLVLVLRGGEKIVIPDLFAWNLLRITLELRRYVPSLG